MSVYQGQQLVDILQSMQCDSVKLIGSAGVDRIPLQSAIQLAARGGYEGLGSTHRVKQLRMILDTRCPNVHDPSHWDGRACRHYDHACDRRTVDLWDRIFVNQAKAQTA